MPTFPVKGKPLVNELEKLFEPTNVTQVDKRAERMARSQKARDHRAEVKVLKDNRSRKDRESA